jgi:hypothetical protein
MIALHLRPNVPLELRLAYAEGREVKTGMMFSDAGGGALFVSLALGCEINQSLRNLGARRGDRVVLLQRVSFPRGERTTSLEVCRAAQRVGQQADGTFVLPRIVGATA